MHACQPAIAEFLFQASPGEFKPWTVEPRHAPRHVAFPDQNGRCVGQRAEPGLAVTQLIFRQLAIVDVEADSPPVRAPLRAATHRHRAHQ
jgi:hypothetical protein